MAKSPNGALTCFQAWPSASSVPWLSLSAWATALGSTTSVITRPSETYESWSPVRASIVGRMSV